MDVLPCIDNWTKLAFFTAALVLTSGIGVAAYWARLMVARRNAQEAEPKAAAATAGRVNGSPTDHSHTYRHKGKDHERR